MIWNFDLALLMVVKVLTLFGADLIFTRYLQKRKLFAVRAAVGAAAGLLLAFMIPLNWAGMVLSGTIVFIVHVLISMGWLYLLYDIDIKVLLFVAAMGKITVSIAGIVEFPLCLIFPRLGVYYTTMFSVNGLYFMIRVVLSMVLTCTAMYLLFGKNYKEFYLSDRWRTTLWLTLIMVFIIDVFIQMVFAQYVEQGPNDMTQYVYQLIKLFMHIFIILLLNTIYMNSRMQIELDAVNALWSKAKRQYSQNKDNIDAINRKCHDLKHRLLALKTANNKDEFSDIYREIEIYDSRVKTGNEVLDVILAEKNLLCTDKNIHIETMIDGSRLDFIDTTDLFVLFGNIMDNCIEAVEQLDGDNRYILCNVVTEGGLIIIHTTNPFAGNIEMEHDLPKTSKKNRMDHGFGMISIRTVVRKYEGEMVIQVENGLFNLDIMIPISQNKAK